MPSVPSHQEQVSEREQREELGAVPGEAPVAGLHVAELARHDPERMLDYSATIWVRGWRQSG